jgi:hypothetical protein
MRSELVFQALIQVTNPFYLCQLTSKASRGLHQKAGFSSAQVINEALKLLARRPEAGGMRATAIEISTSLPRSELLLRAG